MKGIDDYTTQACRVDAADLERFCGQVFVEMGLGETAAAQSAAVLVAADLRGIHSHGVARLQRYVNGLRDGQMLPDASPALVHKKGAAFVIDAGGGMGAPAGIMAMRCVIERAKKMGSAFACVKNSNHFGIAGYYAMMALPENMLGLAMTNTAALGVPTFGRQVMFGTNPLAFAAPADKEGAFVLDMSTTVVSRGKLEVYDKQRKKLPEGWATDKTGRCASDAHGVLEDMFHRHGGGILPLGGVGKMFGGHKGYGLAVMVDILCSVLGGAPFGAAISDTATSSASVSHFFGAISIEGFREAKEFRRDMDRMLTELRSCPVAAGEERVYYAGQQERELETWRRGDGIPLIPQTMESLNAIARDLHVPAPRLKTRANTQRAAEPTADGV